MQSSNDVTIGELARIIAPLFNDDLALAKEIAPVFAGLIGVIHRHPTAAPIIARAYLMHSIAGADVYGIDIERVVRSYREIDLGLANPAPAVN